MQILRVALAATLLAAAAAAQCATLSVTSANNGVTIDLSGAPRSIAILVVGETAGSTSIPVGMSTLDLGLAMPFAPLPLGMTSATGDLSRTFNVPANVPAASLLAQGVLVGFSMPPNFSLTFCTSNVAPLSVGN